MYPDGSFRFAYKGHDENAELFNIFGVAGISNEGATSGMAIPERTVSLGQAVQFNPMVVNTLPAGESATADVTLTADAMGGEYESALTLSTNVPTAETITVPVSLTIEGTPKPEIPEKVEFEFIAGSMSTDYSDFFVQQGVAQVCYIDIKNTGSAAFTIEAITADIPMVEFYDDYFGETYEMPAFDLWYYGKMEDWMTGEMVDQWIGYGGDYFEPATVDANGFRFAIPIMPGSPVHAAPGVTNAKLTLTLSGVEGVSEVEIPITITATDVPVLSLDKFELTYEGVADDFEKEETITLGNDGAYKLTYDYYIDTTGEGEEAEIPDGGGIAPMAAKAAKAVKAPEAISLNKAMLAGGIRPATTTLTSRRKATTPVASTIRCSKARRAPTSTAPTPPTPSSTAPRCSNRPRVASTSRTSTPLLPRATWRMWTTRLKSSSATTRLQAQWPDAAPITSTNLRSRGHRARRTAPHSSSCPSTVRYSWAREASSAW